MSSPGQKYNILSYTEKCFIAKNILENDISLSEISHQFQVGETTLRDRLKTID